VNVAKFSEEFCIAVEHHMASATKLFIVVNKLKRFSLANLSSLAYVFVRACPREERLKGAQLE
jgi:hypothetical protein